MAINIPIISSLDGTGFAKAITQLKKLETNSERAGFIAGKAFLPAVAALGALTTAAGLSVKAAMEDAAAQSKLAKQLQNVVGATDAQIKATEDSITAMTLATGVADNELRTAYGTLVTGTESLTTANELLQLSLDIAAGSGKDLASVSDALAEAYGGNMKALKSLSPQIGGMIKDGASLEEVMAELSKTFGGSAAVAANTAEGKFKRLGVALGETSEAIGAAMLPAIEAVLPYLISFGTWAQDHVGTLMAVGTAVAAIATALIGFKAAQILANAVTVVTTALNWSLAASAAAANTAMTIGVGAAAIAAGLVVAAGAFLAFKEATKSAVEEVKPFGPQLSEINNGLGPLPKKLEDTGKAAKSMADKIKEATEALQKYLKAALEDAQKQLQDAQVAFTDFATNVSDSIKDAFSFADAKDAGDETGAGFLQGLRDQVAGIVKYGSDVKTLLEMGLSQEALQAVLDAGGESGAAIAAELIAGGASAITETNELVKAADNAAKTIGIQAAEQWFQAGVDNAKSYLQGVEAAFDVAQKRLKAKGLKLADIKGISAGFSEAITRTPVASVAPLQVGGDMGMPGGGGNYVINLSTLVPTAESGRIIIDSVRAFNRVAGPADIQVS
jgi:predicted RNase H-like HicB family nuclease